MNNNGQIQDGLLSNFVIENESTRLEPENIASQIKPAHHWRSLPHKWLKWVNKIQWNQHKKAVRWLTRGVTITTVAALINYIWIAPFQQKQTHYKAWQLINSAIGKQDAGGRIEALQDLNHDGVSLQNLTADRANLSGIELQSADLKLSKLQGVNFQFAKLKFADFQGANLQEVDFQNAELDGVKFQYADLQDANFQGANLKFAKLQQAKLQLANLQYVDLQGANLQYAQLQGAQLLGTKLQGAILSPQQVKTALNWEFAHYDLEFRQQLGLKPETAVNKK